MSLPIAVGRRLTCRSSLLTVASHVAHRCRFTCRCRPSLHMSSLSLHMSSLSTIASHVAVSHSSCHRVGVASNCILSLRGNIASRLWCRVIGAPRVASHRGVVASHHGVVTWRLIAPPRIVVSLPPIVVSYRGGSSRRLTSWYRRLPQWIGVVSSYRSIASHRVATLRLRIIVDT